MDQAQIKGGDFTNDSEYIRDLIRGDQAGSAEHEAIRDELIKGEQNGEARLFDGDAFKEKMIAKHAGKAH